MPTSTTPPATNPSKPFGLLARPRLVRQFAQAAGHRITLVVAGAGYGKSVAVDEYLGSLPQGHARIDVAAAPLTSAAALLERVHERLANGCSTIAVDGLQALQGDASFVSRLLELIGRGTPHVRWILATRSTVGLPIGSSLAYGEATIVADPTEFRFTAEEAAAAATVAGIALDEADLAELMYFSGGWATPLRLWLRARQCHDDVRTIASTARELTHRFIVEQAFADIDEDQRRLLHVAAILPRIDARVLELAGFDLALSTLQEIAARTAMLREVAPGQFTCEALFRDCIRVSGARTGSGSQEAFHLQAAQALEAAQEHVPALETYIAARARRDILRMTETHGFDLIDRGNLSLIEQAIRAIDESARRSNPRILALRGMLYSLSGKRQLAETTLQRALQKSPKGSELFATISIKLGRIQPISATLRLVY